MLLRLGFGLSPGNIFKTITATLSGFYKVNATDDLLINAGGDKLIITHKE